MPTKSKRRSEAPQSPQESASKTQAAAKKRKVFLVDDHPIVRERLRDRGIQEASSDAAANVPSRRVMITAHGIAATAFLPSGVRAAAIPTPVMCSMPSTPQSDVSSTLNECEIILIPPACAASATALK